MPRYITIPADIDILNPDDDTKIGRASFADVIRGIAKDPRFIQAVDILEAYDVRRSLIGARVGEVIKVADEPWSALCTCMRRPQTLSPAFIYSPGSESMIRAILDAPSSDATPSPPAMPALTVPPLLPRRRVRS